MEIRISNFRDNFNMAAPLFSKHWYDKPEKEQKSAMSKFQAAVASARTSTDEGVKQVLRNFVCCIGLKVQRN